MENSRAADILDGLPMRGVCGLDDLSAMEKEACRLGANALRNAMQPYTIACVSLPPVGKNVLLSIGKNMRCVCEGYLQRDGTWKIHRWPFPLPHDFVDAWMERPKPYCEIVKEQEAESVVRK